MVVKTDIFSLESNLETAIEIFTSLDATAQYCKKIIYDREIVLWIKRQLNDGMKLQSIRMSINHEE